MGTVPVIRLLAGVVLTLILSACSIQLAPLYDQKVVDAISAANVQTLTLFASLERGSSAAEFPKFSTRYDQSIGAFDALRIQTDAREVPPLVGHLSKAKGLSDLCTSLGGTIASCVNSSPLWLGQIVERLTYMRQLHRTKGLPADRVAQSKTHYEGWMLNLITVENALKR